MTLHYEVLEGDGTYAFSTPLATSHAFNGWADKFLATPPEGLSDLFLTTSFTKSGWKAQMVGHTFSGDSHFGDELDLVVTRKIWRGLAGGIKFTDYRARNLGSDTRKFWAFAQWKL